MEGDRRRAGCAGRAGRLPAARCRGARGPPHRAAALPPVELDRRLAELLRRTGAGDRFFVEFGAGDGTEGNTVFLASVLGWAGVYLEPDAEAFAALEHRHGASPRVRTVRAAVGAENVEALFAEAGVPEEPTVVSI